MDHGFDDILEANRAYASGFSLGSLSAPAARHLAVLTCIDSRIEPLAMLGLQPGDAKIIRNAGARVTDDALRSLVLATNLLDVRRIMVVAHTDCAVARTTDQALADAVAARRPGVDLADMRFHAAPDPEAALEADVRALRESPLLHPGATVSGFEYDVRTGILRQVVA